MIINCQRSPLLHVHTALKSAFSSLVLHRLLTAEGQKLNPLIHRIAINLFHIVILGLGHIDAVDHRELIIDDWSEDMGMATVALRVTV